MLKCPGGEGEGRRDLVGRKKEGAFYVSMLSSFWPRRVCPADQVVDIWLTSSNRLKTILLFSAFNMVWLAKSVKVGD